MGRRRQLDFLRERGNAASQLHGSIVLVEGEAGSGKSRLVAEFCGALAASGLRFAVGHCFEYAKSPFGPFLGALQTLLAQDSDALARTDTLHATLARLFPQTGDAPAGPSATDDSDKLRQFNALADAFCRIGENRPTVIVLEDLQWADAGTMAFMQHIARVIGATALCIVATYRENELARGNPLRPVLARLERESSVWRTVLGPLSDEEMQLLIAETLDGRDAIAPETAQAIGRQAEGNPLFAEELLKSAIGNPERASGARDLPRSLREAVLERLDQFDASDRAMLVQASALGRRFTPDFLSRTLDRPVERLLPTLKRAISQQLIVEDASDGSFAFRHAVTREAVHGELMAAEARPLHATIAAAIEASDDAADRSSELAYQWWAAGNKPKTALYNERAGDEAAAMYAFEDAVLHFERALEAREGKDPLSGELWRKLAWALYRCGMGGRARSAYESAIDHFVAEGHIEAAAQTLISLAHLEWTLQNVGGHFEATTRALDLIGQRRDSPVWFAAHVQLAWTHVLARGDTSKALEHIAQAESFSGAAPVWDRVKLSECRAYVGILDGRPDDGLLQAREGAAIAIAAGDIANAVRVYGNVGLLAARCGEKAVALETFQKAVDLIDSERPGGWPVPWVLTLYAYALMLYGNLAGAESLVERALAAVMDVPSLDVLVAWAAIPIGLRLENGSLVDRCADEDLIDYAFRSGSTLIGDVVSAFAEFYLAKGRVDEARLLLKRGVESLTARPNPGDYDAMFLLIAEHGEDAEIERARVLLRQTEESAKVRSMPASVALFEAHVAGRRSDPATAVQFASTAAQLFLGLEWPLHRAKALELAGHLDEALDVYRSVGARADVRRVESALSPPGRRGKLKGELSAREEEIAQLIMAGKSNRAIAEQLVLSERTIESHVSSIFGKLHISSRRELAQRLWTPGVTRTKDGRS